MEFYGDYRPSLEKALTEIDKNWQDYKGLIICGSHNPKDTEFLINKIKEARKNNFPFYGECFGHQLCAIEYARNVLGVEDATSEEWGQGTFVIKKRKDGLNVGLKNGESYWNNYEVDLPDWEKPKNFFTAQYHASYQSSIDKPHPLIKLFLQYAKNQMAVPHSSKPWWRFRRNAKQNLGDD